ncbi:MAG: hypothetical protein QG597_3558, partial [Actinomycetota bacterium]|nr:hypothetical protein [Actinomycetota bacterium]
MPRPDLGPSAVEPAGAPVGSVFVPVVPVRVFDSRPSQGGAGSLTRGETRTFSVADQTARTGGARNVVPTGAVAVAYNVTVPSPGVAGHLRVMPGDVASSSASAINFRVGETIANGLVGKVDAQRRLRVYNAATGAVDAVVDVVGYFVPAASGPAGGRFTPITQTRVYDSASSREGLLASGGTRKVSVADQVPADGGAKNIVPAGVGAVAYNITVVGPGTAGHLRVFPGDQVSSSASTVNWTVPGDVVANGLQVRVAADRTIKVFNSAGSPVRFQIDVAGYYAGSGALFFPVDPARAYDSRAAAPAKGQLGVGAGQVPRTVSVADGRDAAGAVTARDVVPAGAVAIAYNGTATATGAGGGLRVFPAGAPAAVPAAIAWPGAGYTRANGHTVGVSADRRVSLFNTSTKGVDAIVDTLGYYAPEADTTAPPTPGGLRATAGDKTAALSWTAVAAADLKNYAIYQGPSAAGPWVPAAGSPTAGAAVTVTGLVNGTGYWFTVAARDKTGNESAKSTPVAVTPKAPATVPGAPTGLAATGGDKTASVVFTAPASDGGAAI